MPKPIGNAKDRLRAQAAAVQQKKTQQEPRSKVEQIGTARDRVLLQGAIVQREKDMAQYQKAYSAYVADAHERMADSMYGSANRASSNLMDMATRAKLMQTANEMADIKFRQAKALENPRASTAYIRQAEKPPVSDRAKKVAEIRKGINTEAAQTKVGKGAQSVMLSPYASIEYLGESGKQTIKNQKAYEESDLDTKLAAAYTHLMQTERAFGYGSPEYEAARANYDAVQRELNAFKNTPDKAVDMDSRAAQFMGGVQKLQEEALEGTTGAGRFLGEAALSIGSNLSKLPLNAVVPGASLALMGAEAAAGKAYELGQQGVNAGQALTRGLVSGGIEALTEKVPLDNLVDIIKTGGKVGLMNILKQAATEAGEEGVAYLLNLGADKVAGDPEAAFVWNDFWKSVGMGALSGGIMGGGATAINRANTAAVGKTYQDVAPELVAEGLQMNRDTDAYRTATEMQRKLDAGKTLSNVDVGRVVQDNASAVDTLRQAATEMAEAQVEREVQAAMPKRTAVRPLATEQRMAYTESNRTTEGGMTDGKEVHLRESGQRNDRAYPGGEVSRMEESAGRDQSGQDSRLPAKDARAADLRVGEEVSTASLGIGNGASNDRIRVVTGGDTEATTKARAIAKERGLRLTLFTGGNLTINGEECRAYITGDRAFVRADHSDFDADQLMRHEAGHDQIAKGEIDIKAATENIRKRLGGRNNVQRAAQTYASAFAGADMTVEEAIEEIICDSLGDMNVFSETVVETAFGEVLESVKAAANESRVESKTGPPVEGKASRESERRKQNAIRFQRDFTGFVYASDGVELGYSEKESIRSALKAGYGHLEANGKGGYVLTYARHYVFKVTQNNDVKIITSFDNDTLNIHRNSIGGAYDRQNNLQTRNASERSWDGAGRRSNGIADRQQAGESAKTDRVAGGSSESNARGDRKQGTGFGVSEDLAAAGVETDGNSVGKASRESWSRTDKQRLMADLVNAGFEKAQAQKWIDDVNSISALIAGDPNRLDYESAPGLSSFVSNAEYGGSFDFSTLCKKRRLLTGTFTAIQKALPDTALTADEILEIRRMMAEADLEVSCGLCYVEGSRANMGQFTQEFIRLYKKYNPGKWAPNMAEMNTPDGIEWVRINHPEVYKEYEYFWNHYGKLRNEDKNLFASQQKPKLYQMRTEYKGEILEHFKRDGNVTEKNRKGGLRLQSFSDFETPHLIDTMQIIMDMADVGLAGQAYTKVPNFAWAFGDTGLKINLSLIAKDVDADGKLVFDEKEGMPIADAMALRDRYSENVGTIIVVFTDDQLKAAMADERIDFIIPFHRSQWKKSQYAAMGLPAKTKDYTYQQNEKLIKPTYHEYRGKMVKDKATNYMPNDYWDFSKSGKENAEDYLKMCAANNKRPKFYKLLVNNGDGSYSLQPDGSTDGYWKLLIDFKMYDNDGNGSPQMPVTPEFNMEEANRIMEEYEGGHAQFPVAQGIVDEFLKKKQGKASREVDKAALKKDADYLAAVERNDMTTAQQMVDEAARAVGYTPADRYHQTAHKFTRFSTDNPVAGEYDSETPNGIFFKMNDHDIGIGGDIQMRAYLRTGNTLKFADRKEANAWYRKNIPGYKKLHDEFNRILEDEFNPKFAEIEREQFDENTSDERVNELFDFEEELIEELRIVENKYRGQMRELLDQYFLHGESGYDSLELEYDGHRWVNGKREDVHTVIVFDPNQVKSADPVTYDDNGNVIPLSERFNPSNNDIRFSREASREDVLKAVEKLLAEAEAKLDEQELADQMYYGRKAEVQKRNAQEKLERLREQKNERIAQVRAEGREAVKVARIEERVKRDAKLAEQKQRSKDMLDELREQKNERIAQVQADLKQQAADRQAKISERSKAAKMRSKITRHVNKMQQMLLRPSDKRHVPEHLRKATASVLSAINMESGYELSFGTDAKYHRVAPGTDPYAEKTAKTKAFEALRDAYNAIVQNKEEDSIIIDPELLGDSANGVKGLFDQFVELGKKPIADMNSTELEVVWKVLRSVEHSIANAGKMLSKSKYETTKAFADAFASDAAVRRDMNRIFGNKLALDFEDPYTFFSHYGESGKAIYRILRNAQDEVSVKVDIIAQKMQELVDAEAVEAIQKERHEFTTEAGDALTLTTGQLMSIYNLMHRQQAHDHLMKGGILQPEIKRNGKQPRIDRGTEMVPLSANDLQELAKMLTYEQKKIASELQKMMTEELATWGNEASMAVYGYEKFTGEDYWPIKSAGEGLNTTIEKNSGAARSIKNIGMAKNTIPHANNALEIGDVFDVFAQHTADMVDYSSWLLPMEDLTRLYNWKYKDENGNKTGKTIKGIMEQKGGKGSQKYLEELLKDIQNGIAHQMDTQTELWINRMIGNAKGASVGANMRVVVQQPTAFLRAAAIFDADSLAKGIAKGVTEGDGWEKAKKYAPIAHIKDVGGFDQGNARTISQQLYGTATKLEAMNEKLSWAAAKADAITWGKLWNAAEWETKKRFPKLEAGSDAFYEKAKELFTDMVDQSQVVDGVLQRTQIMRSGNAINKQASSFMGEPMKTMNMMVRAWDNWRHTEGAERTRYKKQMGRTVIALGVTAATNALMQALVDAIRDDDKEKDYLDRVWTAFSGLEGDEASFKEKTKNILLRGNLADNINPVGMYPYASDVLSVMQGYDVTRADADVIADVINNATALFKSASGENKRTTIYNAKKLVTAIGKMFGVSAVNLGRDIWSVASTIVRRAEDYRMMYEMDRLLYTIDKNKKQFVNILYAAETAGETEQAKHIRNSLLKNGLTEEKIAEIMKDIKRDKEDELRQEKAFTEAKAETSADIMKEVQGSKIYKNADSVLQNKAQRYADSIADYYTMEEQSGEMLYTPSEWIVKAEEAKAVGITDAQYILYRLALEMADADGNGKVTQKEFQSADLGLTKKQLSYMWEEDRGWKPSSNPYD